MSFVNRIKQIQEQRQLREENEGFEVPNITSESEEEIATVFFGVAGNRGVPAALSFMFKNGSSKAIPYSYITEIDFMPSEGIEICTTNKKFFITGRNLKIVYDYLTLFKVRYLKENIGPDIAENDELFIDKIEVNEI